MNQGLVLYVEDSEAQRKSLKKALELRGFRVEVAGDVATARRLFEKLRGQVDVRHQFPDPLEWRIDEDFGLGRGPFLISHGDQ